MARIVILIYGVIAYLAFLVTILYAIGFVGNFQLGEFSLPKTIDTGVAGPIGAAILVNVALLAAFAIQHTIMARPAFKRWWTKIIPPAAERSTFVLLASAILMLLFWQWRPMPDVVWHFENPFVRAVLIALSLLGWAMVFYASFLIDHFDLFGLRQVVLHARQMPYRHPPFIVRSLYRFVRHPLMVGFLLAFWFTPTMSAGHLLFAAVTTGYILVGTWIEERDLIQFLGEDYRNYRKRTPAFIPLPKARRGQTTSSESQPGASSV